MFVGSCIAETLWRGYRKSICYTEGPSDFYEIVCNQISGGGWQALKTLVIHSLVFT